MLPAERNADEGDAKQQTEEKMGQANPKTANANPNHIHNHAQASARIPIIRHLTAKRPQSKHSQFKGLQAERNTNNRNHQQQATDQIFQSRKQTATNKPNNITQEFHITYRLKITQPQTIQFSQHLLFDNLKTIPQFRLHRQRRGRFHLKRINRLPILIDPKIQMRPRRQSCRTDVSNDLSLLHTATDLNSFRVSAQVHIRSGINRIMLYFQGVSATSHVTFSNHRSRTNTFHRRPDRGRIVNTMMRPVTLQDGMKTGIGETRRNPEEIQRCLQKCLPQN